VEGTVVSNESEFNQAYAELLTDWHNRTQALSESWLGFAAAAPGEGSEDAKNRITIFVATDTSTELAEVVNRLRAQGIHTDTVAVGKWVAQSGLEVGRSVASAIGRKAGATGSPGALLCGPNRQFWLLSANHVISLNGQATEVDLKGNPNSILGGIIHYVEVRQHCNKVDAAIVQLAELPSGFYGPFGDDLQSLEVWSADNYARSVLSNPREVVKVGAVDPKRTTGKAIGANAFVAVDVLGLSGAEFQKVLIVSTPGFAAEGDSGSLVVDRETKRPVGMAIAQSTNRENFVVAYIETALDLLKTCGGPFKLCGLVAGDARCETEEATGDAEYLDCVKQRVSPHLMQISGVAGVAVEAKHIVVFLENDSDILRAAAQAVVNKRAPHAPLLYQVTGRFMAL